MIELLKELKRLKLVAYKGGDKTYSSFIGTIIGDIQTKQINDPTLNETINVLETLWDYYAVAGKNITQYTKQLKQSAGDVKIANGIKEAELEQTWLMELFSTEPFVQYILTDEQVEEIVTSTGLTKPKDILDIFRNKYAGQYDKTIMFQRINNILRNKK